MKVRLRITPSTGPSFAFEHHGPTICVGRDPECELALDGDAVESVSWRHARIELSPKGAALTDLESMNGTYVNEQPVKARTRLQIDDVVQLGKTGPKLKVSELVLADSFKGSADALVPQKLGIMVPNTLEERNRPAFPPAKKPDKLPEQRVSTTRYMLMALKSTQQFPLHEKCPTNGKFAEVVS